VKKLVSLLALAAVSALALSALALGSSMKTVKLTARLTAGAEVPKPKAPAGANGAFSATLDGSTLKWKLTFAKLSGSAVAAHIHKGGTGAAGPVLVPLCGPCKNGMTGSMKLSRGDARTVERGGVYVNVHTAKNGDGEIRGQIKVSSA
jgi:CHRD domain